MKGAQQMNDTLKILESRRSCRNFDNNKMVSEYGKWTFFFYI